VSPRASAPLRLAGLAPACGRLPSSPFAAPLGFTPLHRGGSGPPLVALHGFTDTWRTWELVLPALERRHDVLAPTLPGHAGGPPLAHGDTTAGVVDAVERAMDDAGMATALREGWAIDSERVGCPVRIVWGTEDRLLPCHRPPSATAGAGSPGPTGWSSRTSATARSSTSRCRRPS